MSRDSELTEEMLQAALNMEFDDLDDLDTDFDIGNELGIDLDSILGATNEEQKKSEIKEAQMEDQSLDENRNQTQDEKIQEPLKVASVESLPAQTKDTAPLHVVDEEISINNPPPLFQVDLFGEETKPESTSSVPSPKSSSSSDIEEVIRRNKDDDNFIDVIGYGKVSEDLKNHLIQEVISTNRDIQNKEIDEFVKLKEFQEDELKVDLQNRKVSDADSIKSDELYLKSDADIAAIIAEFQEEEEDNRDNLDAFNKSMGNSENDEVHRNLETNEIKFEKEKVIHKLTGGNAQFQDTMKKLDLLLQKVDYNNPETKAILKDYKIEALEIKELMDERFGGNILEDELLDEEITLNTRLTMKGASLIKEEFQKPKPKDMLYILNQIENQSKQIIASFMTLEDDGHFSGLQECDWNDNETSPVQLEHSKLINGLLRDKMKGRLTSFAFSQQSKNLFLCGTVLGEIFEVDLASKKVRTFKLAGEVTSIDISFDEKIWAVGTSKSEVMIKKSYGAWTKKIVTNFNGKPIIQIRFYSTNELILATPDTVTHWIIRDMKVMFDVTDNTFISKGEGISQLMMLPYRDSSLVMVAQLRSVSFWRLYPFVKLQAEIARPDYIPHGLPPIMTWMLPEGKSFLYIVIFWDSFVFLVKTVESEDEHFVMCGQKQLTKPLIWGCVLGNRIICMVDSDQNMRLESVECLFANFTGGGGLGGSLELPKSCLEKMRTIYVDETTGIESKSVQERVRNLGDSVGFIGDQGLSKVRLLRIDELVMSYIDKGKWLLALKLCVDVCKGLVVATEAEMLQVSNLCADLAIQYVDHFLKGGNKEDSLISTIIRVSIEALTSCGQIERIFEEVAPKFKEYNFWKEVERFVAHGRIMKIPTTSLIAGSLYLDKNILQFLVFTNDLGITNQDEENFIQILEVVKKRKMWESYIKIGISLPKQALKDLLYDLLTEMENVDLNFKESVLDRFGPNVNESINDVDFDSSSMMSNFFRIYWLINKIFKWIDVELFDAKGEKTLVWEMTWSWLLDKNNLSRIAKSYPQLFLDIIYDLYLNVEFMMEPRMQEVLSLRLRESMAQVIGDKNKWQIVDNYYQISTHKSLLLLLYNKLNEEIPEEIGFLMIKLLNLSMFEFLYSEREWIIHSLEKTLDSDFRKGKFWLCYSPLDRKDFEEQIVRVIQKLKLSKEEFSRIQYITELRGYYRVYAFFEDIEQGPIISIHTHMKFVSDSEHSEYIFRWLNENFEMFSKDNRTRERTRFCMEISQYLPLLIQLDREKAKKLVTQFPNIGVDSIAVFNNFPDLQMRYIESLLENELKQEDEVAEDLKIRYIELKCKLQPDSVVKTFNTFKFPLEECLQVCKKYDNKHAIAHVLFRLGLVEGALKEYMDIIKNSYSSYLKSTEKKSLRRHISNAEYSFQMVVDICRDYIKSNEEKGRQIFVDFLEFIIDGYLIVGNSENYKYADTETLVKVSELRNYIKHSFIEKLLIHFVKTVGAEHLTNIINKDQRMQMLQIKDYRPVIQYLGYEKKQMDDIYMLCSSDHCEAKLSTFKAMRTGSIKSIGCSSCGERVSRSALLVECPHPIDILCAKGKAKYPRELHCDKCSNSVFLQKKISYMMNKYHEDDMQTIYRNSMEREEEQLKHTQIFTVQQKFEFTEMLEDEYNDTLGECMDKIFAAEDNANEVY